MQSIYHFNQRLTRNAFSKAPKNMQPTTKTHTHTHKRSFTHTQTHTFMMDRCTFMNFMNRNINSLPL